MLSLCTLVVKRTMDTMKDTHQPNFDGIKISMQKTV